MLPAITDRFAPAALPAPRAAIHIRLATLADIPFMDELQKKHQKMLGWTPKATLEGKIGAGHVLIAEARDEEKERRRDEVRAQATTSSLRHSVSSSLPLGYVISQDRYMGRDDVGVVYQLNIAPGHQRGLIGATLIKSVFERAAYGCRLFCCWCAQDIAANYFWESIGFVPLAFRAGNRAKGRVHIFWQRRIREGDTTTPYWFPAETRGGMMNEARLVLPIPPGTHWRDAKPIVLPALSNVEGPEQSAERKVLSAESKTRSSRALPGKPQHSAVSTRACVSSGGLKFALAKDPISEPAPKPKREPRVKAKNDPKHVAAARELRDRWMEEVNAGRYLPQSNGKYDVSRMIGEMRNAECEMRNEASALLLPAA